MAQSLSLQHSGKAQTTVYLSHITPHSSVTFTGWTKILLYMHAWWMHTTLNLGYLCNGQNAMCSLLFLVIHYTEDMLPATAQALYCCVKWLRGIVKSYGLFLAASTTILWYKDTIVWTMYVAVIFPSFVHCVIAATYCVKQTATINFLLSEETTVYSRHTVNIFLYLAFLCVQCINLAGLLTLVLASWPCWKNSVYTIQHYCLKIQVWQTWIIFWLAFWCKLH